MKKIFIALMLLSGVAFAQIDFDPKVKYYIKKTTGTYDRRDLAKLKAASDAEVTKMVNEDRLCLVRKTNVMILDSLETGVVKVRIDKSTVVFWTYADQLKRKSNR